MLRLIIVSTILIFILWRSPVVSSGCGCGGGCSFSSGMQCARCCASLVKRSDKRPISENDYSLSQVLLEKWPPRNTIHDSCGCDMGCYFEDSLSCRRCCSDALRRKELTMYEPQRLAETQEERRRNSEDQSILLELLAYADAKKNKPWQEYKILRMVSAWWDVSVKLTSVCIIENTIMYRNRIYFDNLSEIFYKAVNTGTRRRHTKDWKEKFSLILPGANWRWDFVLKNFCWGIEYRKFQFIVVFS